MEYYNSSIWIHLADRIKRKHVVRTLEYPAVTWKLIIQML